ncbi:MAG: signal transduction histidine kinase [Myxococcota bacterium]
MEGGPEPAAWADEVARLAGLLEPDLPVHRAHQEVLASLATLADATGAVLLVAHEGGQHRAAEHADVPPEGVLRTEWHRSGARMAVVPLTHADLDGQVLLLGTTSVPASAVAVAAAASRLLAAHASSVADRVRARVFQATDPIAACGEALSEALPPQAAVLVFEGAVHPALTASWPVISAPLRVEPGSPAARVLRGAVVSPALVTDLAAPNPSALGRGLAGEPVARLSAALDLPTVRSWLAARAEWSGRTFALVTAVTPDRLLLPVHGAVLASAVAALGLSLARRRRITLLDSLNAMSERLSRVAASEFTAALVREAREWSAHHIRSQCEVAVVARGRDGRSLLADPASHGFPVQLRSQLRGESERNGTEAWGWAADDPFAGPRRPVHGIAASVSRGAGARVHGHVVLTHKLAFTADDRDALDLLARELGVVLIGEAVREEWLHQSAVFRHSIRGPVQGLASTAKLTLRMLRGRARTERDPQDLEREIARDIEAIRLWSETHRTLSITDGAQGFEPRWEAVDVGRLLSDCAARYRPALGLRSQQLKLDLELPGRLSVPMDEQGIDLVVSNLLDNARKYTYLSRPVTLGARVEGDRLVVTVEDFGTPIPEEYRDTIYEVGARVGRYDPFRAIAGEGVGLPLARAIVRAHGGDLVHTCELQAGIHHSRVDDRSPYHVVFQFHLPLTQPTTTNA